MFLPTMMPYTLVTGALPDGGSVPIISGSGWLDAALRSARLQSSTGSRVAPADGRASNGRNCFLDDERNQSFGRG